MPSIRSSGVLLLYWTCLCLIISSSAAHQLKRKLGSNHWDAIHEKIQGQKRDATSCPADYSLCPQSVSGGCCPTDRSCGVSSCYATTAAPASACGVSGYIACGADQGGGCCPSGYSCAAYGCSPSAGITSTESCQASYYACAASLGGGCCLSGLACAVNGCYSTAPATFSHTITTTETEHSTTLVITSVVETTYTPSVPTDVITSEYIVPKVTPTATAVAKVDATEPSSSDKGESGLSKGDLAGIITAVIIVLIVVIIASIFIIRRLNSVAAEARSSTKQPPMTEPRSRSSTQTGYIVPNTGSGGGDMNADNMSSNLLLASNASSGSRHQQHQPSRRPSLYPHRNQYHSFSRRSNRSNETRLSSDFGDYPSSNHSASPLQTYDQVYYPDTAMREQNPFSSIHSSMRSGERPSTHERQHSDSSQVTYVSLDSPLSAPTPEPFELEGSTVEHLNSWPRGSHASNHHQADSRSAGTDQEARRASASSSIMSRILASSSKLAHGAASSAAAMAKVGSGSVMRHGSDATSVSFSFISSNSSTGGGGGRPRASTRGSEDDDGTTVSPSSISAPNNLAELADRLPLPPVMRREGGGVAIPSTVMELDGAEMREVDLGRGVAPGQGNGLSILDDDLTEKK